MTAPAAHGAAKPHLADVKPLTFNAKVTSGFGYRVHPIKKTKRLHRGVDFRAACGKPVVATHSGTISRNSYDRGGYGWWVEVKDTTNRKADTRYAHFKARSKLKTGTKVHAGQLLGYVGSTGGSTGCHLHYEQRIAGVAFDPMPQLNKARLLSSPAKSAGDVNKAKKSESKKKTPKTSSKKKSAAKPKKKSTSKPKLKSSPKKKSTAKKSTAKPKKLPVTLGSGKAKKKGGKK